MPLRALLAVSVVTAVACSTPAKADPRYIHLDGEVNALSVLVWTSELKAAVEAKVPEVTIFIDSPGGDVASGMAFIEELRKAEAIGTKSKCVVDGEAASMAAIIFETGCTTRIMLSRSMLLFHEPRTKIGTPSTEKELRETADFLSDLKHRVATMIAARMKHPVKEIEEWIEGRERWLGAAEALERGFTDYVAEEQ